MAIALALAGSTCGTLAQTVSFPPTTLPSRLSVLTRSYDNGRTGANTAEHFLTPAGVAAHGMSLQFRLELTGDDPRIEAQPLYVPDIRMSDGNIHNVLYVCSMSNHVWAFDTDTGKAIWPAPVSLGPPFIAKPGDPVDSKGINVSFGVLSTPVIDINRGIMYLVYWLSDEATHQSRQFQLAALRLSDGQEFPGKPPRTVTGSVINAAGQTISVNQVQKQRAALLLVPLRGEATPPAHKMLYIALTGAETPPPGGDATKANHGWVIAFDVDDWAAPSAAWISTPSSFGGGIWQASQGLAADNEGNVYFMTANGGYVEEPARHDFNGATDFAECFIKLSCARGANGPVLTLEDWFSPFRDATRQNFGELDYTDQDLGSSGPIIPTASDVLLGAGKDGVLYVVKRNDMGKVIGDFSHLKAPPTFFTFDPDPTIPSYVGASPTGNLDFKPGPGVKTHHQHSSPVYWDSQAHGPLLFTWGENGNLRAISYDKATGQTKLLAHGEEFASAQLAAPSNPSVGGMPGGMVVLSADGGSEGIVWTTAPIDGDANKHVVAGAVRAYDASNFGGANADNVPKLTNLWEARGFDYSKFCTPVVVDGKLFVPTYDGRIDVYGLGTTPSTRPAP